MGILDVIIILLLFTTVYFSYFRGAILQVFTFAGIIIGLAIAIQIDLLISNSNTLSNTLIIFESILTALIVFVSFIIFEKFGTKLSLKIIHTKFKIPNKIVGLFVGLFGGIFLILIGAAFILNNSAVNAQKIVLESSILNYLNEKSILGLNVENAFYVIDLGHSSKFQGINNNIAISTSGASYNLPTNGDFASAIKSDYKSVVFIEWEGCNQLHYGTGYVSSSHYVVTAAHVVAGASLIKVSDMNHSYVGRVVLLDMKMDLAVIYVPNLPDPGLKFDLSTQSIGTQTALLGYKEAGPLTASFGSIIKYVNFSNLDVSVTADDSISNSTLFYEVNMDSDHGDSGGPLILTNGQVVGHLSFVYFQGSTSLVKNSNADGNLSYFVSATNYINEVNTAYQTKQAVSTGSCLN